jgi:hypothetical protein
LPLLLLPPGDELEQAAIRPPAASMAAKAAIERLALWAFAVRDIDYLQ